MTRTMMLNSGVRPGCGKVFSLKDGILARLEAEQLR